MKSAIVDKGEKYYTYMKKVFESIDNEQIGYNWLITDYQCYPQELEIDKLFSSNEYVWITGKEFTAIINTENFQWIWGVFSAFPKDIPLEKILESELPYADGNKECRKRHLCRSDNFFLFCCINC